MFLVFLIGIILFKFAVFSFKNDDDSDSITTMITFICIPKR